MPQVLLVADDVWVQNDVSASLVDPGSSVTVVSDPKKAAEAANEQRYDLILVDLQVGSMGGMAVTRELKSSIGDTERVETPVIMLLDRQADSFLARRAGAEAWLVKPFTSQQLRAAVESLTGSG